MNTIKKYWDYFSYLGLSDFNREESLFNYRDIILVNRMVTILQLIMFFYLPIEIFLNGWELVPIILFETLLVGFTLFLNAKKKFNYSRIYFFITAIIATGPFLLITPREAGNALMMLPVACIPVIIFNKLRHVFIGYFIVFGLFFMIDFFRDDVTDFIVVEPEVLKLMPRVFTIMLFIIFFALMYYFKHINLDYQLAIIKKSDELKISKALIEQHNKDITDSINYAKKIQEAYMPPEGALEFHFSDSFLFFKPKDIVSGDFYWIYNPRDEKGNRTDEVYVAVADCTGHGVPGAIMSVICCNALNEAAITKEIRETGKILDETREIIIRNLKSKNGTDRKDGMDISLMRYNKSSKEIEFSGANNPLWYIQNNEIKELKGDKQPVGLYENMKPFTTHKLSSNSLSALFLFTDGYADQFGGEKGKKFKYSNLQNFLFENHKKKSDIMSELLLSTFLNWKGDLEQVDDVCIIGIKL